MNNRAAVMREWTHSGFKASPAQIAETLKKSAINVSESYVIDVMNQVQAERETEAKQQRRILVVSVLIVVVVSMYLVGVGVAYLLMGPLVAPTATRVGFWVGAPIILVGVGLVLATLRWRAESHVQSRFASGAGVLSTAPLALATALMYVPPVTIRDGLSSSPLLAGMGHAVERVFRQRMAESDEAFRQQDRLESLQFAMLEGMTTDQFESSWKMDVRAQQRPAIDLLTELFRPLGWTIEESSQTRSLLKRRVDLDLRGVSRWEAIEKTCHIIGVTPEYPTPMDGALGGVLSAGFAAVSTAMERQTGEKKAVAVSPVVSRGGLVRMKARARPLPVAFAGPVMMELNQVEERVKGASGQLEVTLWAHGLSPSVKAVDQPISSIAIEGIRGSDHSDLLADGFSGGMTSFPWQFRKVSVRGLLRQVTHMDVMGIVSIRVPTEVMSVTLDQPKQNLSAEIGAGSVRITKCASGMHDRSGHGTQPAMRIEMEGKDLPGKPLFVAFNEDGDVLEVEEYHSHHGGIGFSSFSGMIWGTPQSITVKVLVSIESLVYPFEFSHVPLRQASKQPRKLTALKFGNHAAPVTIEILEIDKSQSIARARARVTNHSNKGIESLQLVFQYMDSAGKNLKSWNSQESGSNDPDDPIVAAASEALVELPCFFMPDEATHVDFKLTEIRFSDFTKWPPAK